MGKRSCFEREHNTQRSSYFIIMSRLQILLCSREFVGNSLRRCSNNAAVVKNIETTENVSEKSCDNTERIFKENKSVNSGAVHLKRSKAFQKSECGSQLATGFHKMDPHNIPKMPVGIPTTEKHVPKSKEAE